MRHARVFNLSREDLMAEVVEPWLQDRVIEMGDREWRPSESGLKVLEGPRMETQDLSFGQGWSNALRGSAEVTREVLDQAPRPAVPEAHLIEAESPETFAADLAAGHSGRPIQWSEAAKRLDGRDPEVAAVILVTRKRPAPGPQS